MSNPHMKPNGGGGEISTRQSSHEVSSRGGSRVVGRSQFVADAMRDDDEFGASLSAGHIRRLERAGIPPGAELHKPTKDGHRTVKVRL